MDTTRRQFIGLAAAIAGGLMLGKFPEEPKPPAAPAENPYPPADDNARLRSLVATYSGKLDERMLRQIRDAMRASRMQVEAVVFTPDMARQYVGMVFSPGGTKPADIAPESCELAGAPIEVGNIQDASGWWLRCGTKSAFARIQ